jgi:nucleoside 2-deoxyribosyltransferase
LHWGEAKTWRSGAKEFLERTGRFDTLDPLRGKEQLANIGLMAPSGYSGKASDQVIFHTCKYDVARCSIILCNLVGAKDKSLGTAFEMGWGNLLGKYIITAMEDKGNPHDHAFVRQTSSIILPTFEEALTYLVDVA